MSTILKILLGTLVIGVILIGLWLGVLWAFSLALSPPSQKDARQLTSSFIGFQIDKNCIVNDWDAKSIPDLIVTCTFVISHKQHEELLLYCESQVGYQDPRKTDPVKQTDEAYIFADYRPEEMKSLTISVCRKKPEIYLYWWEN